MKKVIRIVVAFGLFMFLVAAWGSTAHQMSFDLVVSQPYVAPCGIGKYKVSKRPSWRVISKYGDWRGEYLRIIFHQITKKELSDYVRLDLDKYSYVVCYGCTLDTLAYYNGSGLRNVYVAKAFVHKTPCTINIYQVEKEVFFDNYELESGEDTIILD